MLCVSPAIVKTALGMHSKGNQYNTQSELKQTVKLTQSSVSAAAAEKNFAVRHIRPTAESARSSSISCEPRRRPSP